MNPRSVCNDVITMKSEIIEEQDPGAGWATEYTMTGDDNYTGGVGHTATIELDPGENVIVTFTNTYTGS